MSQSIVFVRFGERIIEEFTIEGSIWLSGQSLLEL